MKITQRILSLVMVVVTLVSFMGIAAEAASVTTKKLNLGYMVPIDAKGTKTIETVKLYGDYDYINFYINSRKTNSYFAYEIYSDKSNTKLVEGDIVACDATGTYTFTPKIKLKGTYKSKTYYMVTYAAKIKSNGNVEIDKNSMHEFKVVVKRTASFDDKIVILKEAKNTTKGVYVSWSKLSGANKYYIYRRSINGTKWTKVGATGSSKTSFTDTPPNHAGYVYSVKAINKKGAASRMVFNGLVCHYATAPKVESITVSFDNSIEINWNHISRARYDILRKENNGSWKIIESSYSKSKYKDTSVKSGKTYTYAVRAVISTGRDNAISSYYHNSDKAVEYFRAPTLKAAVAVEDGINVSWNTVSGAKGYTILRKKVGGSRSWSEIGKADADATSFVDTSANVKTSYVYTVRSEAIGNNGSYKSEGVEYIVLNSPKNVSHSFSSSSDYAYIKWDVVPAATQYNVYTMTKSGDWKLYKTEEHDSKGDSGYQISCKFSTSRKGKIKYTVTALRNGANETPIGENVYEMDYYPRVIANSYVGVNGMVVTWEDRGAQSYNIYRREGDDSSKFVLIDSVEGKENGRLMKYCDETIKDKTSYTYLVKGVYNGVEQTNCYTKSKTYSRLPESEITREEKAAFITSTSGTLFEVTVAEDNAPVEIYGYNYTKNVWEKLDYTKNKYDKTLRMSRRELSNPNDDGEYTVCVVYNIDGNRTAFDANIITGKYRKVKFGEVSAKTTSKGVALTFDAVEGAKEYVIKYTDQKTDVTKQVVVKATGKESYTANLKFDVFEDRGFVFVYHIDAVLPNMSVSRCKGNIDIEKTPDIYKVKRNDNGTVTLYWDDYNSGATIYKVCRKTAGSSKWITYPDVIPTKKKINGKKYLYWTDKKAKEGVKYSYKVILCNRTYSSNYDLYLDSYYELVTVDK